MIAGTGIMKKINGKTMKDSDFRRWVQELWISNKEEHLTWNEKPYTIKEYWNKYKWWVRAQWRKRNGNFKIH